MFEQFTDRARRVLMLAQEQAKALRHNYIGTEHLLLGLLKDGEGVAFEVLTSSHITYEDVLKRVENTAGRGDKANLRHIPLTPQLKKVLQLAQSEALSLKDNYIGTEHLLFGLLRGGEGVVAAILEEQSGDLTGVFTRLSDQVFNMPGRRPVTILTIKVSDLPPELSNLYNKYGLENPHVKHAVIRLLEDAVVRLRKELKVAAFAPPE